MRARKKRRGLPEHPAEIRIREKGGAALKAEPDQMEEEPGTVAGRSRARGFIVVAVLWILAALSALVLIYLTYVTNTAIVVAGSTDRVQAEALETAGVELAAYQLTAANEISRPTSGTFNARVGTGKITVTFRSEAARIDLNTAPKGLLTGFMIGLGATPSASWPGARRPNWAIRIRKTPSIAPWASPICRATRRSPRPRNCGWCRESRPP